MTTDIHTSKTPVRELARRIDGSVEVTLAWDECDDGLAVTVFDRRSGELFVLAAESDNALDVFYHPYAHAVTASGHVGSQRVGGYLGMARRCGRQPVGAE